MKWIIRIIGTLFVLAILAIAALFLIPGERIAEFAETEFEKKTGRKMALSGDVSPQIYPKLGISLDGISIANADWSEEGPMLEADQVNVGVDLMALIGGDILVETFQIEAPIIRLQKNAAGQANWDFVSDIGGEEAAPAEDGTEASFALPGASIRNATVIYSDAAANQRYEVTEIDADISLPDLAGDLEFSLTGKMNDQPLSGTGRVNGLEALLAGEIQGVAIAATVGENKFDFSGQFGLEPIQAQGNLKTDISNHAALFHLIEQSPPLIPPGLGQHTVLETGLTMTDGDKIFLRDTQIALDQNRLAGDIDLNLSGAKPVVTASLTGEALDFSAMSTDSSEGDGAANAEAGGWSNNRIDVSGLSAIDGSFAFRASSVDLGSIKLGPTDMTGQIENSRMVLDLKDVAVFDGKVGGQFVVNGRGGLSVRGNLAADGVAMQTLLNDFAGFDRVVADAGVKLDFLGSGESLANIMKSLEGGGSIDVGAGEMLGLDIVGMIRNLDASFQGEGSKTVFDTITGTFKIAGGVLTNNDLNFDAPLLTALGDGKLDLGNQTIDYRVDPTALAEQLGSGVRVPVLIRGPWSDIKFRPDLERLIDEKLEAEKEKLKAEAEAKLKAKEAELKAKAEAKLQEELGLTAEEGQSVEDAVEQKVEDKLKGEAEKALNKLFGRN